MIRNIILLSGPAGSGKSTVALYLVEHYGFVRTRFAAPLKRMLSALGLSDDEIDGPLKGKPSKILGGVTPRYAIQTLGQEWGRSLIDQNLWVKYWQQNLPTSENIVVDDCRYPEEVAAAKEMGRALVFGLVREKAAGAVGGVPNHASERALTGVDYEIRNDDSVEYAACEIYRLMSK